MKTAYLLLLLIVGLCSLAGCSTTEEHPATSSVNKSKMTDSQLEDAIKAKVNENTQLKAANLGVSANADKNEVTLSGTVGTEELRTKAVEIAKSAHSGLIVTDKIDVKPTEVTRANYTEEMAKQTRAKAKASGDTLGSSLDDAWIHTKIVTKLIGNSSTPERKINVDVQNNMVTLRGIVSTADEKTAAEKIAKDTDGVKGVKDLLKVGTAASPSAGKK